MRDDNLQIYRQVMPADGWFFRHDTDQGDGGFVLYRLAAWALTYDDKVIGLVAANFREPRPQCLNTVPPVEGQYLHADELTPEEERYLKSRKLRGTKF